MSEHIGHFSLWGDLDVEEITALFGIEPSCVYRKGELIEGTSTVAKMSTWDLYCSPDCDSMQEQIKSLLEVLLPKADILKSLAKKFHADLNIVGSCTGGASVLTLNHELLQKIVELNLTLNCFYISCNEVENAD